MIHTLKHFFSKKAAIRHTASAAASQLTPYKDLSFAAKESYKLLRTNLLFALPDTGKCRVIGVTSSVRTEGKSTTSINLSYALAEMGRRVLLVDGDLRLPSVAEKLKVDGTPGLSNMVAGVECEEDAIRPLAEQEGLFLLPSGRIPPNPAEMLASAQMSDLLCRLRESYDFILVDLPPVNIVSDALIIASSLDGMLVVARSGFSEKRELRRCVRQLELGSVKILGFVMTDVNEGGSLYSRYKKNRYYKKTNTEGYGNSAPEDAK